MSNQATSTVTDYQTMQELLAAEEVEIKVPKVGDVLEGKVLSVGKNEVFIDIDGIGLGVVRGRELFDESVRLSTLKIGDKVIASVVEPENKEGNIELSFRQAGQERVWQTLMDRMKSREVIKTKILEANKGGLMVEVNGVLGFLPVSQLSSEHYPRVEEGDKNKILEILKSYVGQPFDVQIITADAEDEKLIVSEKAVGEDELKKKIGQLKLNEVVEGEVSGIVDFGIFLKFGEGLEGLVHISELAWSRIDHPKDLFKVSQKVQAQIISIERDRISLSIKRLQPDPWLESIKKYQVGQTVRGKVIRIMSFGAFVELDPEIYGLVHSVELSNNEVKDPSEVVSVGQELEFKIISIEPAEHRLGLSLRTIEQKQ
ncbi:MAG TPA: S1 RNA-binding domain-containing protein [Patescibacteria group bacterium]|jgi:small subunit ribosomal protein S1|nr:S1 RNA-binding domain-containing protein [Patescibacteria group bacterium]